jgi:two-component system sensor kinase
MSHAASNLELPQSYKLVRVLKVGPVSQTLLAVDTVTSQTVVIKAVELALMSRETRTRLTREGSLLRRLPRTGVATIIDALQDADRLYMIMPHVDGVTLRRRLESGPLTINDTVVVARDVLRSLANLHAHGATHRDVKPANIMVNADPELRTATLVDFGLAATMSIISEGISDSSCAPRYMAPELAGVLDRAVDSRADLYSVGIVLYECLAGRPPFLGDIAETLRQHLSSPPPNLRALGVRVPQALEEIFRRLLHKDPADRYRTAEAVLADIDALDAGLRDGLVEPDIAVGSHDWRQTLTEPPLTAREEELEFLGQRLAEADRGNAGMVTIEASSGGGKTSVLDEFCHRAASLGGRVFRGAGMEHSAPQPLQMLTGIVDDLVEHTKDHPALRADLVTRLDGVAGPLCAALPGLCEVLDGPPPAQATTEAHARLRLVRALVELLDSMGEASSPAVIALDDCQWADELTLQVLEAWAAQRATAQEPRHVLIVAAMRTEPSGPHQRLTGLRGSERLLLPPLDEDQIRQVVESMAGAIPAEASRVVVELSRGNPLMVSAVLRGLVEARALAPRAEGWHFAPASSRWQASREAATFLARRFALLAPVTRELLDAGAVLGRTFRIDLAALLVGQNPAAAREAMTQAVERHLVWDSHDSDRFSFVHDKLRASLLTQLDPIKLAELHRRAAEYLERLQPELIFDLAYHFDSAGESHRALSYAIGSAQAARSRHDFELAERQYRIAERGMSAAAPDVQYSVLESLGQILMLRGRYDDAAMRFERARTLADDTMSIAWIEGQLGELVFRRDDLDGAARHMEAGLRVLGEWLPSGGRVQLVLQLSREVIQRCLPAWPRPRGAAPDETQRRDRLRAHLYTQLQYPQWFDSQRLETVWLMLRQMNVAERCPDTLELAHAYAVYAAALALTFPFTWRRGLRYIDRSLLIYRRRGDLRGEGHAASMRACIFNAGGRYQDACDSAGEAAEKLDQFGDRWEFGFAARNRAVALYRLGRYSQAREEAHKLLDTGFEVGDTHAQVTALEVLAKAGDGRVPATLTQAFLSDQKEDIEVTAAVLQAESLRLRRAGQIDDAINTLEKAARLVRDCQPTSTHLVPVFAWLATLHREDAERPLLPHIRRRQLKKARRSAGRAVRYGRFYRNDLPHALRELGVVHALSGHRLRARRLLAKSHEAAKKRHAWGELAETQLQSERLELTAERRTADLASASEAGAGAERSASAPWGLADRFASLLDAGARLASADSPEAMAQAISHITKSLLRAEQCRLVSLKREWPRGSDPRSEDEREIAIRAAQQRRPLVVGDGTGRGLGGNTLTIAGARSALCAPVFVHGEMAGYFLALHSQVDRLFGEEEVQLAEFVARLAGAVLERDQLQRSSRTKVIAAQEAERARVARDLHDDIGQALTSLLLGIRLIESAASVEQGAANGTRPSEVLNRTAELRDGVGTALESVQRLAFDLRPAVLDDLGLLAALRRLTAHITTGDVQVELESVDLEPGERLPAEIETTAYRIAQEAITNVVRHAKASQCSLIIGCSHQRLRLVVEDNGTGFDIDNARSGGLGLLGMKERAALIGGTLRVTSDPDHGTQVVFEVLLEPDD